MYLSTEFLFVWLNSNAPSIWAGINCKTVHYLLESWEDSLFLFNSQSESKETVLESESSLSSLITSLVIEVREDGRFEIDLTLQIVSSSPSDMDSSSDCGCSEGWKWFNYTTSITQGQYKYVFLQYNLNRHHCRTLQNCL